MQADTFIDGFVAPEGFVFEIQPPGAGKPFVIRPAEVNGNSGNNTNLSAADLIDGDETLACADADILSCEDVGRLCGATDESSKIFDASVHPLCRLKILLSLDNRGAIKDSGLTGRQILDIFSSSEVGIEWKRAKLRAMQEQDIYGLSLVPLEFSTESTFAMVKAARDVSDVEFPRQGELLKLLHENRFRELNASAEGGRLAAFGCIWPQILFETILLADYDSASSDGNRYLHPALEWIENIMPGTIASARDCYGNNALMYLQGTMKSTNPDYLARTQDGIDMALADAKFMCGLGGCVSCRNAFGIAFADLMPSWQ